MPRFLMPVLICCLAVAWIVAGDGKDLLTQAVQQSAAARADSRKSQGTTRLEIKSAQDGHFYLQVAVNGTPIRFLVDTGATSVALTPSDAAKAGFGPSRLRFDKQVMTAAGPLKVAEISLREMRVDQRRVYGVEAVVLRQEGGISLLGMSFLRALQGYEVRQDRLVLHL